MVHDGDWIDMPDQSDEPDGDARRDALPATYSIPFTPDNITQGLDDLQKIFGGLPSYFDGAAEVVQGLSEVRSLAAYVVSLKTHWARCRFIQSQRLQWWHCQSHTR